MASTKLKADDYGPTSEHKWPQTDTDNTGLCGLCLQALTINDQLAGGTIEVNTSSGTTTLDLSGFTHNDWAENEFTGIRTERFFDFRRKDERDNFGWAKYARLNDGQPMRRGLFRQFCAGDQNKRLVTPPSMLEISESAVGPCHLCSTLRALFVEEYAERSWWNKPGFTLHFTIQYEWSEDRPFLDGEGETTILPTTQSLDGLAVVVVVPHLRPDHVDVYQFDVVALPGPCQEWLKVTKRPLESDWPMSERSVGFMRQCIDKCTSDHDQCKERRTKPTFIPTRLLDLGDCETAPVRLMESDRMTSLHPPESQLQYAALSYCWGKSLTMTTTTTNKYKHETTGIDVHSMPATFQDAIHVTKKLEIRYLWIDALCIVQDDLDDWEVEAVNMCEIFAHAQVTISAASSTSSAEHFLQPPSDELLSLQFRSKLNPDIFGTYAIRLKPRHSSPATKDIEQSAWISRAWVWQEETMSARQLVFGNKTLHFRCSHGTFLEDGRYEPEREVFACPPIGNWYSHMERYSSRALTFASDRLKAIAGVAKFIDSWNRSKGEPVKYLAGLWQDDYFEFHLRWKCTQPALSCMELMELLQNREQYIAPSWSWASRNTGVSYTTTPDGIQTLIRVIKADLPASHKSAFVSVAFGSSITLSGKFRQTPVEPSSGHFQTQDYGWETSSAYGHIYFVLDWVPQEHDDKDFERRLCLLLTSDMWNLDEALGGLVLAPALDPGTGVLFYYRVGVFLHRGDRDMLMSLPDREITIR